MTKVCICIPARLHSSRMDRKLLYKFGDKTTIELTIEQCLNTDLPIYLLTDSQEIVEKCEKYPINCILTKGECKNGTERISKHLELIDERYTIIVNVQADEPFIDPTNIKHAIEKHTSDVFYTTLHQLSTDYNYVKSSASVKLVTDCNNNVIYYSRSVIPSNKSGNCSGHYKLFTGIYVFNRTFLSLYKEMDDTPLQIHEDIEQLKIIENGYRIKSFPTVCFNEISVNCLDDYNFLTKKYPKNKM